MSCSGRKNVICADAPPMSKAPNVVEETLAVPGKSKIEVQCEEVRSQLGVTFHFSVYIFRATH
jgi:hypothetical protein